MVNHNINTIAIQNNCKGKRAIVLSKPNHPSQIEQPKQILIYIHMYCISTCIQTEIVNSAKLNYSTYHIYIHPVPKIFITLNIRGPTFKVIKNYFVKVIRYYFVNWITYLNY